MIKATIEFRNFNWSDTANTLKYKLSYKMQTSEDKIGLSNTLKASQVDEGCTGDPVYEGVQLKTPYAVTSLALQQSNDYVFPNGTTNVSSAYYNKPYDSIYTLGLSKNQIGIYMTQPGYQWVEYPGWTDLYFGLEMFAQYTFVSISTSKYTMRTFPPIPFCSCDCFPNTHPLQLFTTTTRTAWSL